LLPLLLFPCKHLVDDLLCIFQAFEHFLAIDHIPYSSQCVRSHIAAIVDERDDLGVFGENKLGVIKEINLRK